MKIVAKKGLDIPIRSKPNGLPEYLAPPKFISLNLKPLEFYRPQVLVKTGEFIKTGQPLVENKNTGSFFAARVTGIIKEIRRGLKRHLLGIVIECVYDDFLHFYRTAITVFPENINRESLYFLRWGSNKFTARRAYASGLRKSPKNGYFFSTNQHREERAFINGSILLQSNVA